jgi:hypothetical protein
MWRDQGTTLRRPLATHDSFVFYLHVLVVQRNALLSIATGNIQEKVSTASDGKFGS